MLAIRDKIQIFKREKWKTSAPGLCNTKQIKREIFKRDNRKTSSLDKTNEKKYLKGTKRKLSSRCWHYETNEKRRTL